MTNWISADIHTDPRSIGLLEEVEVFGDDSESGMLYTNLNWGLMDLESAAAKGAVFYGECEGQPDGLPFIFASSGNGVLAHATGGQNGRPLVELTTDGLNLEQMKQASAYLLVYLGAKAQLDQPSERSEE